MSRPNRFGIDTIFVDARSPLRRVSLKCQGHGDRTQPSRCSLESPQMQAGDPLNGGSVDPVWPEIWHSQILPIIMAMLGLGCFQYAAGRGFAGRA